MKKFRMLIFTLVMVVSTIISYAYENFNVKAPEYKQPAININSSKFGEIKEMVWLEKYSANVILILSSRNQNNTSVSCLYSLNIDNGESKLLHEFPSHKTLNNIILFDDPFSSNSIITSYNEGIIKTKITMIENKKFTYEYEVLPIEGFENANSMDFKGNLFFTKSNDNFIYIKQLYRQPFAFFNNQNSMPDMTKHYKKPYYIVTANNLDSVLTYTSLKKNGLHIYSMNYDGTPLSKLNKPIISKIVNAKATDNPYGYIGMNTKANCKDATLNVFMIRRFVEDSKSHLNLDSIPFNLDRFGSVPSIDSITYNEDYSVVYTSYNEKGKGQIKIANYNEKPKIILEDENLFGPLKISQSLGEKERKRLILYFTYKNDRIQVKICDIEGNLIKDITEMIK